MKLKRNLRLEEVVASKQLRLAVETEEEGRIRLQARSKQILVGQARVWVWSVVN